MTILDWTAQLLGIIGTVITLVCFHWNKRKNILRNKLIIDIIWGAHYLLLGAYAGFCTNMVCLMRELVFLNNDKKLFQSRIWLVVFVLCNWVCAVCTWDGVFSLLPALASTLATYSFWQKRVRTTRLIALANNGIMLTYDLFADSYAGILNEVLAFCSTLSALLIHRKNPEETETAAPKTNS